MSYTSRQSIKDYNTASTSLGIPSSIGVDDYMALKEDAIYLIETVEALQAQVDELSPLSGTGSPEGVVESNRSLLYVDTSVPTMYFNPTYQADTGWLAL